MCKKAFEDERERCKHRELLTPRDQVALGHAPVPEAAPPDSFPREVKLRPQDQSKCNLGNEPKCNLGTSRHPAVPAQDRELESDSRGGRRISRAAAREGERFPAGMPETARQGACAALFKFAGDVSAPALALHSCDRGDVEMTFSKTSGAGCFACGPFSCRPIPLVLFATWHSAPFAISSARHAYRYRFRRPATPNSRE